MILYLKNDDFLEIPKPGFWVVNSYDLIFGSQQKTFIFHGFDRPWYSVEPIWGLRSVRGIGGHFSARPKRPDEANWSRQYPTVMYEWPVGASDLSVVCYWSSRDLSMNWYSYELPWPTAGLASGPRPPPSRQAAPHGKQIWWEDENHSKLH